MEVLAVLNQIIYLYKLHKKEKDNQGFPDFRL
jgi:hypothetical protein